ncbi:MAG: hypothetical protein COY47_01090 [Chloroflexi bacterium CG_4_10_14_0_8_um_filter_57_5]|nr:MAG: hypothetical protein COY47_01090 [Chloroflexi bacterium CG_4_10_14_0_8_um_filter_57_5]PJH75792.1 MAG: hypothetical protein CO064_04765 [Anaerolineae bacterium CG_4_9_14_0_8_um_filter_58_9]
MNDLFYRHLPHYHPSNATFFVTFRLAGSLPREVIEQLRQEQEREEQQLTQRFRGETLREERYKLSKKMFGQYDAYLDQGTGPRWLAEPHVAELVTQEIRRLEPQNYHLIAYCIMSNHGHLAIDQQDIPEPPPLKAGQHYTALSHAMRLLKGRTGHYCNQLMERHGPFWEDESYDHVVRDERELERIVAYILDNPVRAGLVQDWREWPFTYVSEDFIP